MADKKRASEPDRPELNGPWVVRLSRSLFEAVIKRCSPALRDEVRRGSGGSVRRENGEVVSGYRVDQDGITMFRYRVADSTELARALHESNVRPAHLRRIARSPKYNGPLQALVDELAQDNPTATTADLWQGLADAEKHQEAIVRTVDDAGNVVGKECYKIYRDAGKITVLNDVTGATKEITLRSFERYVQRAREKK